MCQGWVGLISMWLIWVKFEINVIYLHGNFILKHRSRGFQLICITVKAFKITGLFSSYNISDTLKWFRFPFFPSREYQVLTSIDAY